MGYTWVIHGLCEPLHELSGLCTPSVSPSEIQEIQGTKLKALAHGAVLPGGNRFPRFPHILGIWGPEMEIPK